jgi:hypothetical protein
MFIPLIYRMIGCLSLVASEAETPVILSERSESMDLAYIETPSAFTLCGCKTGMLSEEAQLNHENGNKT